MHRILFNPSNVSGGNLSSTGHAQNQLQFNKPWPDKTPNLNYHYRKAGEKYVDLNSFYERQEQIRDEGNRTATLQFTRTKDGKMFDKSYVKDQENRKFIVTTQGLVYNNKRIDKE